MDTDFFDLGGMSDVADDVAVHNLMQSLPDGSSFAGLQSTDQHSYSLHDMDDTSFMDSRIAALVDDCIEASEFLPTTTGQRLNLSSLNGLSAIHLAAHSGKFPIIRLLLSACPEDVDLLSHDSQTPLHIAAAEGRAEVVPELLRSGANAMLQDVDGRTALHLAASRGHIEVVRVLLDDTQGQAMIRMSDAVGKTALHHAVLQERDEIVRLLLEKGADPRTRVG
jgi:ankyrin repeat protein